MRCFEGVEGRVRVKNAGGRERTFCRVRYVVALTRGSEPSFQAETKDSSSGVYDEMSWRNPVWISGDSYEWRDVGSEGVFLKVIGLFRRMANELILCQVIVSS